MSLINKMLKDIDQREGEQQQLGRSPSHYESGKRALPAWVFMLTGIICTVVVLLVLLFFWRSGRIVSTPATQQVNSQTANSTQAYQHAQQPLAEVQAPPAAVPMATALVSSEPDAEQSPAEVSTQQPQPITKPEPQQQPMQPQVVLTTKTEPDTQHEPAQVGEMSMQRSQTSPRVLAERRLQQAMNDLQAGRTRQGAQRLQEALLLAPDYHEVRQQLAVYYFSYGFLTDALAVLEQGLDEYPGEPSLLLVQARILERAGEPNMALQVLRLVPNELPVNADLLVLRGALASELEEHQLASTTYETLTAWRPHEGRWWLGLALAREQLQLPEQALQAFLRALNDPSLTASTREFIHQRVEELNNG